MQNKDLIRELEKIFDTLSRVTEYLEKQSQANAELHMSDKVPYPPLTSAAGISTGNLRDLISRLYDEDNNAKAK